MQKEKIIILSTVFLDVLGMGIVIPILPYYVKNFSASPLAVTWLFSVFALFSFFSAPVLGALSDRIGRRPSMIISICSSAIGWLVFASAHSLVFLFIGRIIDGMAAGNFSTAQSYLSDLAKTEKERTANMGVIGMIFGIGFIVGPALGSVLARVSTSFPFWFVGVLAATNAIAAYRYLPETNFQRHQGRISFNPFKPIISGVKDLLLRSRYIAWLMFSLAFASMQTVFALYLIDVYGFNVNGTGLLFTIMGVIMAVNQGFLLPKFWLKRFSESFLEVWLFPVFILAFISFASGNKMIFFIGVGLNALTQTIIRAVMSSRMAGLAGPTRRGEVMGIITSIMSLGMFVSPMIAGWLYGQNKNWPFYYGAMCLLVAFLVIKFCCRVQVAAHLIDSEHMELGEVVS